MKIFCTAAALMLLYALTVYGNMEEFDDEVEEDLSNPAKALECVLCGKLCKFKCGSRRFRSCCFRTLRKRAESTLKFGNDLPPPNPQDLEEYRLNKWE
ncbi:unnamed protein product [Allacma fusca]|uniref:Uncharacterized protein n=1 Tax=Allacma fusca TaxID=39272 RepID=A0A8J2PSV9_9HEXA|nr:unnamed protein product [Allacma fusca]